MHFTATVRSFWLGPLVLAALLLSPAPTRAFPSYFNNVPNGVVLVTAEAADRCTLCHTIASPGMCEAMAMTKPCLNAGFGMPYVASGWTPALAAADLDGDGFSNGQELQDPTGAWRVTTPATPAPGVAAHVTSPFSAAENPGLHDADMDHVCWFGRDTNNDFLCTGNGEKSASDRDCDDGNAARHTGADELCDGADQDCDGTSDEGLDACDPGVGDCGVGQGENRDGDCLPREQIDGDRDRYCHLGQDLSEPADWDCADANEQNGQIDCDEFDEDSSPGGAEGDACHDGADNDCDADIDTADGDCAAFVDSDGDGFCPMGEDQNADHLCDTEDELESDDRDCDDGDDAFSPKATEDCTSGEDENCDGLLDGRDESCGDFRDEDRDGFCPGGRDGDGDFLCDQSGEAGGGVDCDDSLSNVYEGAPENCIDERDNDCDGDADEASVCVADRDADEDGYCPLGRDLSDPLDGDCTDSGEDQAVSDCDDGDDDTSPDSIEDCADRTDNDCDGLVDLTDDDCKRLLDGDGDAYCPAGHDTNGDGDCLDFDEERPIRDCDDDDPERRPRIGESCDDGIDNDCNDLVDGFDEACGCDNDDACPVSEPCMLGRCVENVGCVVVAEPACDDGEDGGIDVGPGNGGRLDANLEDDDAGSSSAPRLEEVGCGCHLVGTHPPAGAAPLLALFGLLIIVRARRRL